VRPGGKALPIGRGVWGTEALFIWKGEQMPAVYECVCDDCGAALDIVKMTLDSDNDLTVVVKPCEQCCEEAVNTAVERERSK